MKHLLNYDTVMAVTARDLCEVRYIDAERVEAVLCSLIDRAAAEDVANVFRVLADPTRVAIIHALSFAELCNCDLASVLRISESAVSHQMRELRLMKLVSAEKRGRMVYYRLADTHIRHIFEDTLRHVREGRP
ncbi:MAG: winged helix-turn-helix transcriptional regulator [Chloroflexota bacterium]|nr:winged helix-turn-helix transcriptional regulator [Chloroflexota bacterium]